MLAFPDGKYSPVSPKEAPWFNLIASEPVLAEASMAVALRQQSPSFSYQLQAETHALNAIGLIQQRIMSSRTATDDILGAVATMAVGAVLTRDNFAWNAHIHGLASLVKYRLSSSSETVPSWFRDLIVQSVLSGSF